MHASGPAQRYCRQGFSLIELLIVLVIIGILSSIAYPSFMGAIRKSRRADAVAALNRVQHAQERYRANNASYAASVNTFVPPLPATSPDGHYAILISNPANNPNSTYTVEATAKSQSPQIDDLQCRVLRIQLNDLNGSMLYSSTNASNVTNQLPGNPCWVK